MALGYDFFMTFSSRNKKDNENDGKIRKMIEDPTIRDIKKLFLVKCQWSSALIDKGQQFNLPIN